MTNPIVTRQYMIDNITSRTGDSLVHFVGRALVVLFERQTQDEKSDNTTRHHNGIGFAGNDGRSGVLTAKSYLRNRTLQDWQLDKWTRNPNRLAKYHGQLNEAAMEKAGR